jgi:hypothetical protein
MFVLSLIDNVSLFSGRHPPSNAPDPHTNLALRENLILAVAVGETAPKIPNFSYVFITCEKCGLAQ